MGKFACARNVTAHGGFLTHLHERKKLILTTLANLITYFDNY